MKKTILLLMILLLSPPLIIYGWLSLTTGQWHYTNKNFFSFWLYTPDRLKNTPFISNYVDYTYNFNPDNQQTRVTITWSAVQDMARKKRALLYFIQKFNGFNKYDCSWIYNDKNNYMNNYQRYCIFQKEKSLELEYFDTET